MTRAPPRDISEGGRRSRPPMPKARRTAGPISSRKGLSMLSSRGCLPLLLAFFGTLPAQTPTGKIAGTVRDPAGAAIPGAAAAMVNVETGSRFTGRTNQSGIYTIAFLPPGQYRLSVEKTGFRQHLRNNVVMEIGRVVTFDITLEVGALTESITVTAETPLLQAETSSVNQLIENRTIIDMPLVSRRAASLVRLMGNVAFVDEGGGGEAIPLFSIGGGRARNQMWTIDGGSAQTTALEVAQLGLNPPVETLQEFNVQSNNYSAEHGRTTGGVISMTTKSGTNQLRGTLYEYFRNEAMDARRFFSPGVSPRKYNVFGATLGGPVRRDRTHFFASYEGARRREGVTRIVGVPTPEEIAGDFSGRGGQLIDPVNKQPFPRNIIPIARMDPVGRQLAALFPVRNVLDQASGVNNYRKNAVNATTQDAVMARIDHQFRAADRIYARHFFTRAPVYNGPVFTVAAADPSGSKQRNRHNLFTAGWLHTITPRWFNEFRYTRGRRLYETIGLGSNGSDVAKSAGLRGLPSDDGMPTVNVTGYTRLGGSSHVYLQDPISTDQFSNALNWMRGRHAVKFGLEYRRSSTRDNNDTQRYGNFTFTDIAPGRGFGLASLLLGWVASANVLDSDLSETRSQYYAGYVQDDWKVSRRLTLNLGVRWDMDAPRWEANNRQSGFDPFKVNPVSRTPGVVTFAGLDGLSAYAHAFDRNNVVPRLGFAWRPVGNRTVVRGGFGIVSGTLYNGGVNTGMRLGFSDSRSFSSPDNGLTAAFLLKDGVPSAPREALGPAFGAVAVGQAVRTAPDFLQPDQTNPYSIMFNFAVQRQLRGNTMFETTYQANLSHRLGGANVNINEIRPEVRGRTADQRLRPFPQFGNVTLYSPAWGNSTYHSMNVKVEKRFSHGLNFLANYTWSKFIDDVISSNELGSGGPQSYYAHHLDKGLSANDIPHRLVASSVFELPVGKGRRAEFRNGALNQVLGGWQLGAIAEMRSGPPFGVTEQTNRLNAFSPSQRPNLVGDPKLPSDRPRAELIQRWFDISAFTFPGDAVLGNAGRTVLRGPGFANLEASLMKNWKWADRRTIQLRGEFFNVLNRPNFGLPSRARGNAGAGTISATVNDGRIVQIGLKLAF